MVLSSIINGNDINNKGPENMSSAEILSLIIKSIYFMMPAYFANMAPVIMKKRLRSLAIPIDADKKWNGKPLFGKNKTWRGLIFGIIFGIIIAFIQFRLNLSISIVDYSQWFFIGALLGFGAIFGDLIESMVKRQLDRKPGQPFIPWDQIDFVLGGLIFSGIFIPGELRLKVIIALIILSPLLHIIVNHMAFYLHIRNEKW